MLKRFAWTLVFSVAIIGVIIYPNVLVLFDIPTDAIERSKIVLFTITVIEALLVFLVTFSIINEYFTLHPNYKSLIDAFRSKHPTIPDKYLKESDEDDDKDKDDKKNG